MLEYFDNYETMPAYDKVFTDVGRYLIATAKETHLEARTRKYYEQNGSNPCEVDLMDKLAIVLKVTAGHYNLSRPFEQEPFENKYKN
jgi:hypothetical protein